MLTMTCLHPCTVGSAALESDVQRLSCPAGALEDETGLCMHVRTSILASL